MTSTLIWQKTIVYCSDRPIKKLTQFYKSNRWHYLLKKKFEITHLEPWFIRYFHVLPKSFAGYCTCKPIERVFFFPEILWILYLIIQELWFWFDSQTLLQVNGENNCKCNFIFSCDKVELCNECIDWAKEEKRTFLRQALEVCVV